jgi:hypothetical protein
MAHAEQTSDQRWVVHHDDGVTQTAYTGTRAQVLAEAHVERLTPKAKPKRRKRKKKAE